MEREPESAQQSVMRQQYQQRGHEQQQQQQQQWMPSSSAVPPYVDSRERERREQGSTWESLDAGAVGHMRKVYATLGIGLGISAGASLFSMATPLVAMHPLIPVSRALSQPPPAPPAHAAVIAHALRGAGSRVDGAATRPHVHQQAHPQPVAPGRPLHCVYRALGRRHRAAAQVRIHGKSDGRAAGERLTSAAPRCLLTTGAARPPAPAHGAPAHRRSSSRAASSAR